MRQDPRADFFAQCLNIRARRVAEIEEEVAMLFRNLRAADSQPATARRINQSPCLMTIRVFERRSTGFRSQRL